MFLPHNFNKLINKLASHGRLFEQIDETLNKFRLNYDLTMYSHKVMVRCLREELYKLLSDAADRGIIFYSVFDIEKNDLIIRIWFDRLDYYKESLPRTYNYLLLEEGLQYDSE